MSLRIRATAAGAALAAALAITPAHASVDEFVAPTAGGGARFAFAEPNAPGRQIHERGLSDGNTLGELESISAPYRQTEDHAIGVDAAGSSIVAWTADDGSKDVAYLRRRAADGSLGPVRALSPAGADATGLKLAVAPNGAAVAAWLRVVDGDRVVQARRVSANGTLGPVRTLSSSGASVTEADLAIAPDGTATAAWLRDGGSDGVSVHARAIAPDSSLTAVQTVGAPAPGGADVRVTGSDAGTAVVAWTRMEDGLRVVRSRTRTAAGDLGTPQRVTGAGADVSPGSLATSTNAQGRTIYVFHDKNGVMQGLRGRIRWANGALQPGFDVIPGFVHLPAVALDASGNAVVAWQLFNGTTVSIHARRRAVSGQMGDPRQVSTAGESSNDPHVVVDGAGKATIAWRVSATGFLYATTLSPSGTYTPVRRISGGI